MQYILNLSKSISQCFLIDRKGLLRIEQLKVVLKENMEKKIFFKDQIQRENKLEKNNK